jgi:hypothetical protein
VDAEPAAALVDDDRVGGRAGGHVVGGGAQGDEPEVAAQVVHRVVHRLDGHAELSCDRRVPPLGEGCEVAPDQGD